MHLNLKPDELGERWQGPDRGDQSRTRARTADRWSARRKALALWKWERLNPDPFKYEMIVASTATVTAEQLREVREFVEEQTA